MKPDQGYAWITLSIGFVMHIILGGVLYSQGIFYEIFLNVNDKESKATVALACSMTIGIYCMSGPFIAALCNLFGSRRVAVFGSVLACSGLILSSFTTQIYQLIFTFGIMTGFGIGMAYLPVMDTMCSHFDKYRNFAVPFCTVGASVGNFCFPPMISYLQQTYGWRGAVLLVGGISLHLIVSSALLRPDNSSAKDKTKLFNFKLLTNLQFVLLLVFNLITAIGLSVIGVHLSAYAGSLGFSMSQGAWLFSAVGFGGLFGRIAYGLLAQKKVMSPLGLLNQGVMLSGLLTILCPLVKQLSILLAYATLYGVLTSAYNSVQAIVVTDMVGTANVSNAFGLILFFESFGYIMGGPVAGVLYDLTNYYPTSIYFGGACQVFAVLVNSYFWMKNSCEQKKEAEEDISTTQDLHQSTINSVTFISSKRSVNSIHTVHSLPFGYVTSVKSLHLAASLDYSS